MAACLLLIGCSRMASGPNASTVLKLPPRLDERSYASAERAYRRLDPGDPSRAAVREKMVEYLVAEGARAQAADEYDSAVSDLAAITALYQPSELAVAISPALGPLARYVRARGERRGEEGRVLSALWLQKQLHPKDREPREQYDLLRRWSLDSRKDLGGVAEQLTGLIEVMGEHARLTPAPEVLATLADLLTERRNKLIKTLGTEGQAPPNPGDLSFQDYREATVALSRSPLDLAAVYLVHGNFGEAFARLRALETVTGLEPRIRTVIEMVLSRKPEAADALLALSRAYLDAEENSVARALCTQGLRKFPRDARFPQCLGRLAAADGSYADAALDYGDAVRLAPAQQALYDEALEVLANLMRGELFSSDPTDTRELAEQARIILEERLKRWPSAPPPVSLDELELAVGIAEMSAGNTAEARRHFEASLKKRETRRALLQLGQLESREGRREQAEGYLRRALDRSAPGDAEETRQRAQILEQLGDLARAVRDTAQARSHYAEALGLWEDSLGSKESAQVRAFGQVRRGILLSRLGRDAESLDAFELSMQLAPDNREVYGQVLSLLVTTAPRLELAAATLRRLQRQVTLEPEWKVYFALWVGAIAARAHAPLPADLTKLLTRLSRSDAWWGHLAQFALGTIDHAKLKASARARGEETESYFYEGVRLLGRGEEKAARAMFRRVIDSHMVGFYEYQMAQELLWLDAAALLPWVGARSTQGSTTSP